MNKYYLSELDFKNNFFHFTEYANIDSIKKNGLLPKKGKHAGVLEDSEKVFFVKGLDNLLILFDCWINVYKKKPLFKESSVLLKIGSKVMRTKYFPKFWVDIYFRVTKNSKVHRKVAFEVFDKVLENCILFNLNIKEEEDFTMSDVDEIKARGYKKKHLKTMGYSEKYSDINGNAMDEWNLHTKSNVGIGKEKISLCYCDNSYKMKDIFKYILKNTSLNIKDITPVLYDYIRDRKIEVEIDE